MNDNNKQDENANNGASTPDLFAGRDISTEYATFSRRLYASLIDLTLLSLILSYIIAPLTYTVLYGTDSPTLYLKQHMNLFSYQMSQAQDDTERETITNNTIAKLEDYLINQNRAGDYFFEQFFQVMLVALIIATFWYFKAGTPGKLLLRLRVVDAKSGAKPDLIQCIVRVIAYTVSAIPLCIGFFWMKYDKKAQCFHDILAGTVVVRIIYNDEA